MWTASLCSVFVSATGVLQSLQFKEPRKQSAMECERRDSNIGVVHTGGWVPRIREEVILKASKWQLKNLPSARKD